MSGRQVVVPYHLLSPFSIAPGLYDNYRQTALTPVALPGTPCMSPQEYTRVRELAAQSWGSWRGVRGRQPSGLHRDENATASAYLARTPWHFRERETGE